MLAELTAAIARAAAGRPGFAKAILLDLGDAGAIRIDGTGETVVVNNADDPAADATVSMTADTLSKLMAGELGAPMAVMTGKIKVRGETGLALKLASFL